MKEGLEKNRARWDEVVAIHVSSDFYDMESFRRGESSLHSLELGEVGDVRGKSLLHLQCHFGQDTLSWARQGARVTGVDFSERAIEQAQSIARELAIDARFVRADVLELDLGEQFDVVFTSYGILLWLPDLSRWAKTIARHLKKGGIFYIAEGHPFADIFDESMNVTYPYYPRPDPVVLHTTNTYADEQATVTNTETHEWPHSMSEVFSVLLAEGLTVELFREHPFCVWKKFHGMIKEEDGYFRLPKDHPFRSSLPMMFSLRARR